MENEKRYLSLSKKIAYGSGDFGSNFFFMLVSSFMLIYLTDAIGLNAGICGTLMMLSKCMDGVTDVFFGHLIDRTHSKMGKARPWMFFSAFPLALCTILVFSIPNGMEVAAQYAYFFVLYTAANALFYTANNISYATLSALITKNDTERVSLGSFRYAFAVTASILVSATTMISVQKFGGGVSGWRTTAFMFSFVLIIFNSIASLCSKEVVSTDQDAELVHKEEGKNKESFLPMLKLVVTNKYYLIMLAIYLLTYGITGVGTGAGAYYCQYVLGNASLLGVISMSSMVMIIGLIFNPMLVKKYGMYKVNLISYIMCAILSLGVMIFSFQINFVGIVILSFIKAMAMAPLMGSLNALVAEVAQNVYLKRNVHTEGMMFSCSSLGMKLGSGVGTAIVGWILAGVGYSSQAAAQSEAVLMALKFIYGGLPFIFTVLIVVCLWRMKVIEDNNKLRES